MTSVERVGRLAEMPFGKGFYAIGKIVGSYDHVDSEAELEVLRAEVVQKNTLVVDAIRGKDHDLIAFRVRLLQRLSDVLPGKEAGNGDPWT